MLNIALVLFVLAAASVGLYMAARIFRGTLPPMGAVALHGLAAAAGLLLVIYVIVTAGASTFVQVAAGILVVAALGGFLMLTYHLRKQTPPKAIVVIHALAAVAGVAILLGSSLGMI